MTAPRPQTRRFRGSHCSGSLDTINTRPCSILSPVGGPRARSARPSRRSSAVADVTPHVTYQLVPKRQINSCAARSIVGEDYWTGPSSLLGFERPRHAISQLAFLTSVTAPRPQTRRFRGSHCSRSLDTINTRPCSILLPVGGPRAHSARPSRRSSAVAAVTPLETCLRGALGAKTARVRLSTTLL